MVVHWFTVSLGLWNICQNNQYNWHLSIKTDRQRGVTYVLYRGHLKPLKTLHEFAPPVYSSELCFGFHTATACTQTLTHTWNMFGLHLEEWFSFKWFANKKEIKIWPPQKYQLLACKSSSASFSWSRFLLLLLLKTSVNLSDCCPSEVEMVSSALMCCSSRIHWAGVCRVEVLKLRVCGEASGL